MFACDIYSPYKTFTGPVGGLRSTLPTDAGHLSPYYHSLLTCVDHTVWQSSSSLNITSCTVGTGGCSIDYSWNFTAGSIVVLDLSMFDDSLRGFSDVIIAGRYAYFSPLQTAIHTYASKVVRLYIGPTPGAVGSYLAAYLSNFQGDASLLSPVTVLDLSLRSPSLRGFSSLLTSKYDSLL